jgi:hypothetical protein
VSTGPVPMALVSHHPEAEETRDGFGVSRARQMQDRREVCKPLRYFEGGIWPAGI